jgi:hypothetical protein
MASKTRRCRFLEAPEYVDLSLSPVPGLVAKQAADVRVKPVSLWTS